MAKEVLTNGAALRAALGRSRRRKGESSNLPESHKSEWKILEELLDRAFRNVMGADDNAGQSG